MTLLQSRKCATALASFAAASVSLVAPSLAEALDGDAISKALQGNAILNDGFGCVHYETDTRAMLYGLDGTLFPYTWGVKGNRYVSREASCGPDGCLVERVGPSRLRFFKPDGSYEITVRLVEGPACNASRLTT